MYYNKSPHYRFDRDLKKYKNLNLIEDNFKNVRLNKKLDRSILVK